jgi:hypothetical protein
MMVPTILPDRKSLKRGGIYPARGEFTMAKKGFFLLHIWAIPD